jgi:Down syndrome cell adhesion protein
MLDGPKVLPFEFPSDLQVGMKIRVMCSVSQGDQPLKFVWYKDSFPINTESGLKIQNFKDYSILAADNIQLTHAANISCTVSNEASQATYSSILKVNGMNINDCINKSIIT